MDADAPIVRERYFVMKRFYQDIQQRFKNLSSDFIIIPLLVMLSIAFMTAMIAAVMQRNLSNVQNQAMDKQLKETELQVNANLNGYAQLLWSGVGRVNSGEVTVDSWRQFAGTYKLPTSFPAIYAFGVSKYITPEQRESVRDTLSQQYGRDIVFTSGDTNQPSEIIAYIEPMTSVTSNAVGYDARSESVRRQAMDESSKSGEITLSNTLQLFKNAQAAQSFSETGLIMYAPYYDQTMPLSTADERLKALRGHIYASFQARDLFSTIFKRIDNDRIGVRVTSGKGEDEVELYRSTPHLEGAMRRTQQLIAYGQHFTVEYTFKDDALVSRQQVFAPFYTAIFGTMLALLVGVVAFYYLRSRHHRLLFEKERDVAGAKDDLLSLASHQLRTPATGVKQYVGMVLQGFAGDISPQQKDFLEKAYQSNERQLQVINDILHLAKLEQGRIILAKSDFDLAEIVRDVIDEQRNDSVAAQLKVSLSGIKKASIYADNHMLRMVVENLISNAIKYTDPGGRIAVRLARGDDGYTLSVKDTGVGIDEADQSKLFKQFSRVMNPRSHSVSGTGVGLYLARHLILLHNGTVSVESQLGKGATFTVFIPYQQEEL
ncbi:TPA: hypothetical protein DDX46_04085 [Candidatus Saccharibacteria bacterium]|nr:MAG: putative histidine kinase [Candidatus Saccharibacteria bacterium GW2011_GWC2_44_17]HBH77893.1 hypothetical protein [Candidatus Saccharibacteria bacterium]